MGERLDFLWHFESQIFHAAFDEQYYATIKIPCLVCGEAIALKLYLIFSLVASRVLCIGTIEAERSFSYSCYVCIEENWRPGHGCCSNFLLAFASSASVQSHFH